jgi:hypothetical protein
MAVSTGADGILFGNKDREVNHGEEIKGEEISEEESCSGAQGKEESNEVGQEAGQKVRQESGPEESDEEGGPEAQGTGEKACRSNFLPVARGRAFACCILAVAREFGLQQQRQLDFHRTGDMAQRRLRPPGTSLAASGL